MKELKVALPLLVVLLVLQMRQALAQAEPEAEALRVQWISWEEAMERSATEPRKIVVDIYAERCDPCEQMENTTFRHPQLVRYLNQHFYAVRLDPQRQDVLRYGGKEYSFVRMKMPALVFLDEELELIQAFVGYRSASQIETIAHYFASDQYKETPWTTFQRRYRSTVRE